MLKNMRQIQINGKLSPVKPINEIDIPDAYSEGEFSFGE
jgi:hypothetical protein